MVELIIDSTGEIIQVEEERRERTLKMLDVSEHHEKTKKEEIRKLHRIQNGLRKASAIIAATLLVIAIMIFGSETYDGQANGELFAVITITLSYLALFAFVNVGMWDEYKERRDAHETWSARIRDHFNGR